MADGDQVGPGGSGLPLRQRMAFGSLKALEMLVDLPVALASRLTGLKRQEVYSQLNRPIKATAESGTYQSTLGKLDIGTPISGMFGVPPEHGGYIPVNIPQVGEASVRPESVAYGGTAMILAALLSRGKGAKALHWLATKAPRAAAAVKGVRGAAPVARLGARALGTAAYTLPVIATIRAGEKAVQSAKPPMTGMKKEPFETPAAALLRAQQAERDAQEYIEKSKQYRKGRETERSAMQSAADEAARMDPARAALLGGVLGSLAGSMAWRRRRVYGGLIGGLVGGAAGTALPYAAEAILKRSAEGAKPEDAGLEPTWRQRLGTAGTILQGVGRAGVEYTKAHPWEAGGMAAGAAGIGAGMYGMMRPPGKKAPWMLSGAALEVAALGMLAKAYRQRAEELPVIGGQFRSDVMAGNKQRPFGQRYPAPHPNLEAGTKAVGGMEYTMRVGEANRLTKGQVNDLLWAATMNRNNPQRLRQEVVEMLGQAHSLEPADVMRLTESQEFSVGSMAGVGADFARELEETQAKADVVPTEQEERRKYYQGLAPARQEQFKQKFGEP